MTEPVGFLIPPNWYDPRFPNPRAEDYAYVAMSAWADGTLRLVPEEVDNLSEEE